MDRHHSPIRVTAEAGGTRVRFTHEGLVPEYECYDVCANAWGGYINGSLRSLITTARATQQSRPRHRGLEPPALKKETDMSTSFRTTFTVAQAPQQTYQAICDVRSWWSGEIEGYTDRIGEEFSYTVPGVHFSRQRVTELEPGHKVSWLVVDSRLDYLQDKQEWNGTTITFDLVPHERGTEITFVHPGLSPRWSAMTAAPASGARW